MDTTPPPTVKAYPHSIIVWTTGDELPDNCVHVNPTSRSKEEWTKAFSPFYLGPCTLPGGTVAKNMENAWQYAKVYPQQLVDPNDKNSDPGKGLYFSFYSC